MKWLMKLVISFLIRKSSSKAQDVLDLVQDAIDGIYGKDIEVEFFTFGRPSREIVVCPAGKTLGEILYNTGFVEDDTKYHFNLLQNDIGKISKISLDTVIYEDSVISYGLMIKGN